MLSHDYSQFLRAGNLVSMESLDRHPHQPHLVAVGRGDGSLCFIDLRHHKRTLKVAKAHSAHGEWPSGGLMSILCPHTLCRDTLSIRGWGYQCFLPFPAAGEKEKEGLIRFKVLIY